jgi:hypothetical protein
LNRLSAKGRSTVPVSRPFVFPEGRMTTDYRVKSIGIILLAPLALSIGCGSATTTSAGSAPVPAVAMELREVGAMCQEAAVSLSRPPSSIADFKRYEEGYPTALKALRSGQVVLRYGTPLGDANTILAHEKDAPNSGGWVVMADGQTVKQMSAAEFQAAPKAGK